MNNIILGIIGGMGPEATISFYSRIIKLTDVKSDQDHFNIPLLDPMNSLAKALISYGNSK